MKSSLPQRTPYKSPCNGQLLLGILTNCLRVHYLRQLYEYTRRLSNKVKETHIKSHQIICSSDVSSLHSWHWWMLQLVAYNCLKYERVNIRLTEQDAKVAQLFSSCQPFGPFLIFLNNSLISVRRGYQIDFSLATLTKKPSLLRGIYLLNLSRTFAVASQFPNFDSRVRTTSHQNKQI